MLVPSACPRRTVAPGSRSPDNAPPHRRRRLRPLRHQRGGEPRATAAAAAAAAAACECCRIIVDDATTERRHARRRGRKPRRRDHQMPGLLAPGHGGLRAPPLPQLLLGPRFRLPGPRPRFVVTEQRAPAGAHRARGHRRRRTQSQAPA
jgi:hypothetical protein